MVRIDSIEQFGNKDDWFVEHDGFHFEGTIRKVINELLSYERRENKKGINKGGKCKKCSVWVDRLNKKGEEERKEGLSFVCSTCINNEIKEEIIKDLEGWAETFDIVGGDEDCEDYKGIDIVYNLAEKLRKDVLNCEDCENIIFHLGNIFNTEEEEREGNYWNKRIFIEEIKEGLKSK